jgi:hypothetical protein
MVLEIQEVMDLLVVLTVLVAAVVQVQLEATIVVLQVVMAV